MYVFIFFTFQLTKLQPQFGLRIYSHLKIFIILDEIIPADYLNSKKSPLYNLISVEMLYLVLFSNVQLISIVSYAKIWLLFHFVYRCSLITSLLGHSLIWRCSVLFMLFVFAHSGVHDVLTIWVTWLVSCKRQELLYIANCLPFTSTWFHPRFLVGSVLLIFLVFCVVFLCVCLRPVFCIPNVASVSGLSSSCVLYSQCW